jgi:hypothetical protein
MNQQIRKVYNIKMDNDNIYGHNNGMIDPFRGRYNGYTPEQAAKRAFSQAFKMNELIYEENKIHNISLINKKDKIIYLFELERIKLQTPIIKNLFNKEIAFKFKNKVKLLKIDQYY